QTKQFLKNIKAILTSIYVPLDVFVKVTIYLKDLSKLEAVNQVYAPYFPQKPKAPTLNKKTPPPNNSRRNKKKKTPP
ncbi:RidA family protein, partial [Enterococcus faecalis]|uniref:RidA family protein n=1 Tax=Enterococcus faecalis TaxID=1351 RepID=UPI003CC50BB5